MSRTQYDIIRTKPVPNLSIAGQTYTAFDFETTGLDYKTDRITEIGAVKFTVNGIIEEYSCLINPQYPVSEEATRVTGITNEMLVGKPLIAEIIPNLFDFFGNTILLAHHAPFDVSFLKQACFAASAPVPMNMVLDSRLIAKKIYPNQPGYSLERLLALLGIPSPRNHRALDDARSCMNIFLACVNKISSGQSLKMLSMHGFILSDV
ncbi:MAG: 3'-5' exonuclease [Spirochaetales bacterium]|nr:3'-5' exonuclease [Spirochaetales bacterium]